MNSFTNNTIGFKKLGVIVIGVILFVLIGNLVMAGLLNFCGIDPDVLNNLENVDKNTVEVLKWGGTVNHIIIFTVT